MIFVKEGICIVDTSKSDLIEDLGMVFASIEKNVGYKEFKKIINCAESVVDDSYKNDIKQNLIKNFDKKTAKILCKLL